MFFANIRVHILLFQTLYSFHYCSRHFFVSPLIFLFGPSYGSILAFIFFVSIAESLLSVRLLEYICEVTPKGKESVIIAMSNLPVGVGFIISGISGVILSNAYCPDDGERECWKSWLSVSFLASPALICIFLFRRYLENRLNEENPYISCCNDNKLE